MASLRREFCILARRCCFVLLVAATPWQPTGFAQSAQASIHFEFRPISFSLDTSETPQKHAPETMAGGCRL
jgi:hypothetical protein